MFGNNHFSFFNNAPSFPKSAPPAPPAPNLGVNMNFSGGLPAYGIGVNATAHYTPNPSTTVYVQAGNNLPSGLPQIPQSATFPQSNPPPESQISMGVVHRF